MFCTIIFLRDVAGNRINERKTLTIYTKSKGLHGMGDGRMEGWRKSIRCSKGGEKKTKKYFKHKPMAIKFTNTFFEFL